MAVIRERTRVFNQPVGVVRADAGSADIGRAVSNVAATFQQIAFREAAEDAQKKGIEIAEAVEEKKLRTINPETGKPEAFKAPKGFGRIASAAYQSVIDKRYEDSIGTELRVKAQEIALKYQYDPESYDEVMSNYIGQMANGAEGKYKTFVETTGAKFLALTKLNIQERVASRSRQNAAGSILTGISTSQDDAYSVARAGGFIARENEEVSEAQAIHDREFANAQNGVSSALLKVGADQTASRQLKQSIALGAVEYLLSGTANKSERNAIDLAIRTRGNQMSGLPKGLQEEVKSLLTYVEPANIEAVLRHSSVVSSDYNAVEQDQIQQASNLAKLRARELELTLPDTIDTLLTTSSLNASDAFASDEAYSIQAGLNLTNDLYTSVQTKLDQRFLSDETYSRSEREGDLRDARQNLLRPYLIQAAAEGNVEEFRIALVSNNPEDMSKLSLKQRTFISEIYNTDFFNPNEDTGFAREVLSANINQIRKDRDRETLRLKISQSVTEAATAAESGALSDEEFNSLNAKIEDSIGPNGLTADQGISESNRLSKSRAFGEVTTFAARANSNSLNNLILYVDSRGKREGMSPDVVAAGNRILEATDDVDAVVSKIKGIKSAVSANETQMKEAIELRNNSIRILGGGGNANDKADRDIAQDMLNNAGIDLAQFDQLPETQRAAALSIMRSAPPQGLIDKLDQIGSGLQVANAEQYLDLFAALSNDPTETGVFISRFGNAISPKDAQLLTDIHQIRLATGGSVNEIATTLVERQSDPKSRVNMDVVLNKMTPTAYALDQVDDPIIAEELASVVEYMALTGKSASQINSVLSSTVDSKYAKSRFIADPRFPAGSIKRSRYSLEAVFPEEDDRNAFVTRVNEQLPSGYSLIPNLDADEKRVMLVPDESTAGLNYFSYFVDENEELRPLIIEQDGQPMWPTFDRSDIADHMANKASALDSALREQETEQKRKFLVREELENRLNPDYVPKTYEDINRALEE
jgi:hypothetical protein